MNVWNQGRFSRLFSMFCTISKKTFRKKSFKLLLFILALVFARSTHKLFSLKPVYTQELKALALERIQPRAPVFLSVLNKFDKISRGNFGPAFELESALWLAEQGEKVLGFNLDLTFASNSARVIIAGRDIILPTTEFDVITDNLAAECKSTKSPGRRCKLDQFIKERNMIAWCRELVRDYGQNKLTLSCRRSRRGKLFVCVKSPATRDREVLVISSWLSRTDQEMAVQDFVNIIFLLARRQACVLFKHVVPFGFAQKLKRENIAFKDRIDIEVQALVQARMKVQERPVIMVMP